MSDYKTEAQIEFSVLMAKLEEHDINAVDVARELQTTPQAVSMWRRGERNPRPLTMQAMRKFVARTCGGIAKSENSDDAAVDMWRRRARRAEQSLATLQNGLRILLSQTASSRLDEIVENHIEAEVAELRSGAHKPKS